MTVEAALLREARLARGRGSHRIFTWLLLAQWALAIVLAVVLSPYTYTGTARSIHPHVILAIVGGGVLNALPLLLIRWRPDAPVTRHVVAIAQMLWSAVLITITGGRIETHFHVFVSLAFLAVYRDWRVLLTATAVVAAEHLIRGLWWPDAVYGSANPAWWRFLEHVAWVLFEDIVLLIAVRQAVAEMAGVARHQAQLQAARALVETKIEERTRELRTSLDRYRALVESTDAMPFECQPATMELTYVAPQAARLLGHTAAALHGGHFFLPIVHPEDRVRVLGELDHARPLDFRVVTPAGAVRYVRALFSEDAGSSATVRGVLLDVTKQRELERELSQAHKLESVGRLAAGVAHEINTPMQYISDSLTFVDEGVTDLLGALGAVPNAELQYIVQELPRAVARALDGTARVSQIVRSMKVFASPDSHDVATTDLNDAIASTVTIARSEYKQVADLVLDLAPIPGVPCVAGEINQVLLGLVVNAAQAIGTGSARGTITISTRVEADHVAVSVADTGCGIPEQVRDRIFDPFFTTKPVGQGTGQGLAVARSIIERHHGTLTFESTVGAGSTFTVRLPIDSRPVHEVAA